MSNVSVYAGTDPYRVEVVIDGIIFTSLCTSMNAALVCATHVCRALGLGVASNVTINGKPLTAMEPVGSWRDDPREVAARRSRYGITMNNETWRDYLAVGPINEDVRKERGL